MMERYNVATTSKNGERVASTYADTYYNDEYCDDKKVFGVPQHATVASETPEVQLDDKYSASDEWQSPSDLLIGKVDLIPPFTSKITRGRSHKGILGIGEDILARERERFKKYMNKLMLQNDVAWNQILEREKKVVAKKVKDTYQEILRSKCKIMTEEINSFYETTLQELENHLQNEVANVVASTHASIVSDLNTEIKEKLEKEKIILVKILQQRYDGEVKKIKHYYKLILDNEERKHRKLLNSAIYTRNDALKAFYRQIEAENITGTMYVMSTERKTCKIKQFLLNNYQNAQIFAKQQKVEQQRAILDEFSGRKQYISDINKKWEAKIQKILQLFLKFISFSLKLLPEQSTFLLDLEKMVVIQLNEIQKSPKTSSILVEEEPNIFEFEKKEHKETVCDKGPFVIIGDTSDSIPTPHGSRETLGPNVDLPMVRLQRKFVYAKCDRFNEVKDLLEAQRCKCMDGPPKTPSPIPDDFSTSTETPPTTVESESSDEPLLMDDIKIFKDCPGKRCQDWLGKWSFPDLNTYADFNEDNYKRVKAILGDLPEKDVTPEYIQEKQIIMEELPFAATKEKYHHVGTQFASEEDLLKDITCQCTEDIRVQSRSVSVIGDGRTSPTQEINDITMRRKNSLLRVVNENPKLLKMFTDESFDFLYSIK